MDFDVSETTIERIHAAYQSGRLTVRRLVQTYLERIEACDQEGPAINAIISINADALAEADRQQRALKTSGMIGPLHGIPVVIKDQVDVQGMPTTLGSVMFKDFFPEQDAFAVKKLRKAGAIILAKTTLGEFGGGDTHGSLFGSTRNPYDLQRTAGGSSGGSAASIAANFCTVALGLEGVASIRRPAAWNSVAGMRPSAGLVSRTGVYSGWPLINSSLGPMARTVADLAKVLDVIVGYDPEDPVTARGFGRYPADCLKFPDKNALRQVRIGILREPIGNQSEPDSEDFKNVAEVFERAIDDLKAEGTEIVDPVMIPNLKALLARRASLQTEEEEAFAIYFGRNGRAPYKSRAEAMQSPDFPRVLRFAQMKWRRNATPAVHYEYLKAREQLMTSFLKVMADHRLDAIIHKAVEHQPTLIKDAIEPPYVNLKGAISINTFLAFVPSIVVPAGFTRDNLPAGITFLGRPYDDGHMVQLAYAYEQATRHRRPPACIPF